MVKVQHFTSPSFEKNISQLGERVQEYKETRQEKELSNKELLKESVKGWSSSLPVANTPNNQNDKIEEENDNYFPNYFGSERDNSVRQSLDRLISVVLHGDLEKALGQAKKMPPFFEDAFHDALVDKVVPEMKKRGLI